MAWSPGFKTTRAEYFPSRTLPGESSRTKAAEGDFAGAEAAFRSVSQSAPLNEVFNNLGAAQSRLNKPETTENFKKALEGDSADPDYHFNLGCALWRAGQYPAAVESLRAAVARDSSDTEATTLLGRALKQEGPRQGDPRAEPRPRMKTNYEEAAYRQLQAELGIKR